MTKNQKLFQELKPKYEAAYLAANGKEVDKVVYEKGYVIIGDCIPSKVRVAQLPHMIEVLLERAENINQ